jgi:hypothetical protein
MSTAFKNHLERGNKRTWCGRDMRKGWIVTIASKDAARALYGRYVCKSCIHAFRKFNK